ncbi:MAG: hypothetical protein ACT4PJ_05255 [Gemmatimonadaceae bacterium]
MRRRHPLDGAAPLAPVDEVRGCDVVEDAVLQVAVAEGDDPLLAGEA